MKFTRMLAALTLALLWCSAAVGAQTTAFPAPAASSTPGAPSDPCSSILSIVNRPTIGTGVCTVRAGHVLVETGYINAVTTGTGGGNSSAWGASLIRFGTADSHLDVEFAPPNANYASVGGSRVSGSSDMAFVVKYEGGYTAKSLWGVNAQFTVPSGTRAFTASGRNIPETSTGGIRFHRSSARIVRLVLTRLAHWARRGRHRGISHSFRLSN